MPDYSGIHIDPAAIDRFFELTHDLDESVTEDDELHDRILWEMTMSEMPPDDYWENVVHNADAQGVPVEEILRQWAYGPELNNHFDREMFNEAFQKAYPETRIYQRISNDGHVFNPKTNSWVPAGDKGSLGLDLGLSDGFEIGNSGPQQASQDGPLWQQFKKAAQTGQTPDFWRSLPSAKAPDRSPQSEVLEKKAFSDDEKDPFYPDQPTFENYEPKIGEYELDDSEIDMLRGYGVRKDPPLQRSPQGEPDTTVWENTNAPLSGNRFQALGMLFDYNRFLKDQNAYEANAEHRRRYPSPQDGETALKERQELVQRWNQMAKEHDVDDLTRLLRYRTRVE